MTQIWTHIELDEIYTNPLRLEINILAMINSNIRAFKYNISDLKPVMFVNDTTRHIFLHLKNGVHDVNTYPFEIMHDVLREKKSYDKTITKQICDLSKNTFGIQDLLAHVYFIKTRYIVKNSQTMVEYLPKAKTTQDIVKIVDFLTALTGINRGKKNVDWKKLRENSKKLHNPFPTNIEVLAKEIGGYYKGDINFIHAPSSHGKSTLFFWDLTETIKKNKNMTAKVYLSEMSEEIFLYRLLAKEKRKHLKPHEYEMTEEDVYLLEELYGNRLSVEAGFTAKEICNSIITERADMISIDSLQFLPRDTAQPTPGQILNELNEIQSAINNAGSSAMIISHLNTTKVNEMIDTNKGRSSRTILFDSCMPRDDMMEWSSACQKLGRRTLALLNPGIVTGNDRDKNTLFVKLNKNSHGNAGIKFELGINYHTFEILNRGVKI